MVKSKPRVGSLVWRLVLVLVALWWLICVPESLSTWDSPSSGSGLPFERNMPRWGNYAVALLMLGVVVMLIVGWIRRRSRGVGRAWAIVDGLLVIGCLVWSWLLVMSETEHIRKFAANSGASSIGTGWEYLGAFLSACMAVMLARDAWHGWRHPRVAAAAAASPTAPTS